MEYPPDCAMGVGNGGGEARETTNNMVYPFGVVQGDDGGFSTDDLLVKEYLSERVLLF